MGDDSFRDYGPTDVAGGDDALGHLGFAARPGNRAFGGDVFNACPRSGGL